MRRKENRSLLLCLVLLLVCLPFTSRAQGLGDLEGHWAQENMIRGMELQWIHGYEDGTMRPDGIITRAEFISLLNRSLGLPQDLSQPNSAYGDIASAPWAEAGLRQAERAGYLSLAFPGNSLSPQEPILREEAAVLLDHVRVLKPALAANVDIDQAIATVKMAIENKANSISDPEVLAFNDRYQVRPNFLSSIRDLTNQGIISGYDNNSFGPKDQLTRAQAMTLLLRASGEQVKPLDTTAIQLVEKDGKFYLQDMNTGDLVRRSQAKDGIVKLSDKTYLIGLDGSLAKGFIQQGKKTFYADGQNGLVRGWKQVGDKLYYFSPMDYRMYKDGIFSTGYGVYWFGKDGGVREGYRPGGHKGIKAYWAYPDNKELSNKWLEGEDQALRFRGQEIANFAASFEGRPFNWFGTDLRDPAGVYCCGNTYSAYKEFGIHIPGPNDVDMRKHKGYEMVRAQHENARQFGGYEIPADFSKLWPGDLVFNYSPNFYLGFNHVGIFMGHNGKTPIYIHATLKNGLTAEDTNKMNIEVNRRYNKTFIRYNTAENVGNGIIPER